VSQAAADFDASLEDEDDEGESLAASRLLSIIERIERLDEEIAGLRDDRKDILAEAKSAGFEPQIIQKVVALRKKTREAREEERELTDLYLSAIGE
jgi:uncharacterized protein (UPF0335 family)